MNRSRHGKVVLTLCVVTWYTAACHCTFSNPGKRRNYLRSRLTKQGRTFRPTIGPGKKSGNAIPLGTTMASTSPEIDRQIERNGYALVKGRSISQPHLPRGDSKP